jgi:hypothetical protein
MFGRMIGLAAVSALAVSTQVLSAECADKESKAAAGEAVVAAEAKPSAAEEKEEAKRNKLADKAVKELLKKPVALTPAATEKNGQPVHDRIVDFEAAICAAQKFFEVTEDVRHDYVVCEKAAEEMEEIARRLLTVHDDRLRFKGREFHYDLELLVQNASNLRTAVTEHRRTQIFELWANLVLVRARMIAGGGWK